MATTTTEVCDLFLTRVNDYRLNTIFQASGSLVLNTYLEPYLLDSIVEFDICNQDLTYTTTGSATDGYFSVDLTTKNKIILSQIMVVYWLTKEVQDVLQMNNLIVDHDFKLFSQAQNLQAKKDYLMAKKEEVSQLLINYDYKNNDWSSWRNQVFA